MKAIRRIVYVVALLGLMACLVPFSAAQAVKAETGTAYTPLYRYWSASIGDHVYSTDPSIETLDDYVFEMIQCYVWTNLRPIASFTYSPEDPVVVVEYPDIADNVTFDSSGSSGSNLTYAWDFGDNSYSDQRMPKHQYHAVGPYHVKLVVTDDHGTPSAPYEYMVLVRAAAEAAPLAEFQPTSQYKNRFKVRDVNGDGVKDWFVDGMRDDQGNTFEEWVLDKSSQIPSATMALMFNSVTKPAGECYWHWGWNPPRIIWCSGDANRNGIPDRLVGSKWLSIELSRPWNNQDKPAPITGKGIVFYYDAIDNIRSDIPVTVTPR